MYAFLAGDIMKGNFLEKIENFVPNLVEAIIIFVAGYFLTKLILKIMSKGLNIRRLDTTIHKFLMSLVRVVLMVLIIVMSLSAMNVPMSSIITTLGAAGLAVSLALQDSLSNAAGGFIILFSKPFKCGDYIRIGDEEGYVDQISILYTRILTIDNQAIMIPNGSVAKSTIVNKTAEDNRRLELKFSISYNDDHHKAMDIIRKVIADEPRVKDSPDKPLVAMCEQGESAVVLIMRAWIPTENYWEIRFKFIEEVKEKFDEAGISIPFNQLDVHISK